MRRLAIFSIVLLLSSVTMFSQTLSIKGTSSTNSTCKQNGTIRVDTEHDDGGDPLIGVYYSIVAQNPGDYVYGETESSDPNGYTFNGVPPGSHKVVVKLRLASTTIVEESKIVTVNNEYTDLVVGAFKHVESLLGCDKTGVMYVNIIGGKKPLKISVENYTGTGLINPIGNEYDSVVGSKYFFRDVPSGLYKFKVEDACGSIEYAETSLGTVDLSSPDRWFWWNVNLVSSKGNTYDWLNSCDFYVRPALHATYSGGSLSGEVVNYYNKYPGLTFQVGNGIKQPIATMNKLQVASMKFEEEVKIHTSCGILSSKIFANEYNFLYNNNLQLYHKNIYACDSLSLFFNNNIDLNSSFRVKIDGVESEWYSIELTENYPEGWAAYYIYGGFSTGFSSIKQIYDSNTKFEVQLKNQCGGLSSYRTLEYNTRIGYYSMLYMCGGKFTATLYTYSGTLACFPIKYVLTHTVTGERIEKEASVVNRDTISGLNEGLYNVTIEDKNGDVYATSTTVYAIRNKPKISTQRAQECEERKGYFIIDNVFKGYRIELIESPIGTNYYYDKIVDKDYSITIFPNNGKSGDLGIYKFKVTDTCQVPTVDTATVNLSVGYIVDLFEIDTVSINCAGMTIKPRVKVLHNIAGTASSKYFSITGPPGFQNQNSVQEGTPILLNIVGEYILKARNCLRPDTIYYDGGGLGLDMNKSVAFICPESQTDDGRIHVVGIGGDGNYTYYLSNQGDGGAQVIGNPAKYIATNTTGEFYNYGLHKGTTYDVTIVDGCGSVRVQQFTIGDLSEVRIAFVDKNPVCVGEPIQFRSMALPNPTFEWYKPGAITSFSSLSNPVIDPANLSDAGIYKVSIKTSLCVDKIEDIEVPVTVQSAPTLVNQTANKDQKICKGDNIQAIVYVWGGSVTSVSVTGLPIGIYANIEASTKTVTISGTTNNSVTYTITTLGGCNELVSTGTIEVSNPPTLVLKTGSENQIACKNTELTITYGWSTITTDLTLTGTLPIGIAYNINNVTKELKIFGTPTENGVFNYTITAKTTDPDNICPNTVLTGKINVVNNVTNKDVEATVKGLTILVDALANDDNISAGLLSLASAKAKTAEDAAKATISINSNKIQVAQKSSYTFTHAEKINIVYTVKTAQNVVICGEEEVGVVVYLPDFILEDKCSFEPKLHINLLDPSFSLTWQKSTNNTSWSIISTATTSTLPKEEMKDDTYYRLIIKKGTYTVFSESVKLKVENIIVNKKTWYNVDIE